MPFVLTFREGTGPRHKPLRHGTVVAMHVNGHTYGATLNMPAGVKTAAIRMPDNLPTSCALGKRVFLREGDRWEAALQKSARIYEVPTCETLSESVVGFYEPPVNGVAAVIAADARPQARGRRAVRFEPSVTFVFKWTEMSEAAKKTVTNLFKVSRQRPRPYPAPHRPRVFFPPPGAPPSPRSASSG